VILLNTIAWGHVVCVVSLLGAMGLNAWATVIIGMPFIRRSPFLLVYMSSLSCHIDGHHKKKAIAAAIAAHNNSSKKAE
jgi:hypothetical protein